MKSNSIIGHAYSMCPAETTNISTYQDIVDNRKFTVQQNDIYFFTGDVPDEDTLKAYTSVTDVLAAHESNKAFEFIGFDLTYDFDNKTATRTATKTPVQSEEFNSLVTGKISWSMMRIKSKSLGTADHILWFPLSIGTFDDEVYVTLSTLDVETGKAVRLKDITIAVNDALVKDLV